MAVAALVGLKLKVGWLLMRNRQSPERRGCAIDVQDPVVSCFAVVSVTVIIVTECRALDIFVGDCSEHLGASLL